MTGGRSLCCLQLPPAGARQPADSRHSLVALHFPLLLSTQVRLFSVIKYESVIHEFDP